MASPTATNWRTNTEGSRILATLSQSDCIFVFEGDTPFDLNQIQQSLSTISIVGTTLALVLAVPPYINPGDNFSIEYIGAPGSSRIVNALDENLDTSFVTVINRVLRATASASSNSIVGSMVELYAETQGGALPFTYAWTIISSPGGSAPEFSSTTALNPTVTFDTSGSYQFRVAITDDEGTTSTSDVTVVVDLVFTTALVDELMNMRRLYEVEPSNKDRIPALPTHFATLVGGKSIELSNVEPDASTSHTDYYYNTTLNILCRRIWKRRNLRKGVFLAYWEPISR